MMFKVESIDVIGEEVAIRWVDGAESFHKLEILRRNCPCALCRGENGLTGPLSVPAPEPTSKASFELSSVELVGSYGIRFFWCDGHSSGIYSLCSLRSGTDGPSAEV